jgi:hypothetical protein
MRFYAPVAALVLCAAGLPAAAQDVGVPACDSFLKTYETCITAKAPPAQQSQMRSAIDQVKANWKLVAATDDGKKALDQVCKQTGETLKQQLSSLGCSW